MNNADIEKLIADILITDQKDIHVIDYVKKGMTNDSFLFERHGQKYIIRIPGKGTGLLIDRKREYDNYCAIRNFNISDEIIYIDSQTGYKISRYYDNSRVCNPQSWDDVSMCLKVLKDFHSLGLTVPHNFNLFEQINMYENLWNGKQSHFSDYSLVKRNVFELKSFIEKSPRNYCLAHIDPNPDNFLITPSNGIKLIDWEYAGMQDSDVDIAMFAIYSGYDKERIDKLADIYYEGFCPKYVKVKIYCYVAVCGLLWSNWCEYEEFIGKSFGEYALLQYQYAKNYYQIAINEMRII